MKDIITQIDFDFIYFDFQLEIGLGMCASCFLFSFKLCLFSIQVEAKPITMSKVEILAHCVFKFDTPARWRL